MANIDPALESLGVGGGPSDPYSAVESASSTISAFDQQNLSPQEIYGAIQKFPRTVGGVFPDIGAAIPEVGRIPLPLPDLTGNVGTVIRTADAVFFGTSGQWQSILYGYDMNRHHPKIKFLFKVGFIGFTPEVRDFYFFVHRCDKPKIRIQHQDVNFYNFRTRVKTQVTFEPLQMTFLDEIGNTVNEFFVAYMKSVSNQVGPVGSTGYHTDYGFGPASSTIPYKSGYSNGKEIVIEQIFANGIHSNRFHFKNPRIETFDFDELAMDESAGSHMTISFTYDALECETVSYSTIHSWGATDLLRGGGTSGVANGGASSIGESGLSGVFSGGGSGIGDALGSILKQPGVAYDALQGGIDAISQVPGAISDLINGGPSITSFNNPGIVSSGSDTISTNIQDTLQSISSGDNLQFNGAVPGEFNDRRFSGEVLGGDSGETIGQNFP